MADVRPAAHGRRPYRYRPVLPLNHRHPVAARESEPALAGSESPAEAQARSCCGRASQEVLRNEMAPLDEEMVQVYSNTHKEVHA